ncbi:hypothetical protein BGZ60DRAFT_159118 [Tricladium varicosporioides]|nr:hypothetical protein BGZ60DRAFT_159118 [Hymenoscyphus varicosporioides]
MTQESNPNGFLVLVSGTTEAKVATAGPWQQIIQAANISVDPSSNDTDVLITANNLWKLQFSSASNAQYFNNVPSSTTISNHAWQGDALDSGVMVLSSQKDPKPEYYLRKDSEDSIWKEFGITEGNKQLNELATILDPLKNVQVMLHEASTPDPYPNAFWCTTTTQDLTTTAKLEFILTVKEEVAALETSPVWKVVTWINTKVGLSIDLDDLTTAFGNKIPDILISPSRITIWTFDDNGALTSSPVSEWHLSIQIKIAAFNLAIDFAEGETSFYLLPAEPSSQIINDLEFAVGSSLPGLDRESIPSTNDGDPFKKIIGDHLNLWYVHLNKDFSVVPTPALLTEGTLGNEGAVALAGTTEAVTAASLNWGVALLVSWMAGDIPVLIGLSYESKAKVFHGSLILSNDPILISPRSSQYDHRLALPADILKAQNIDINQIKPAINIWTLFTDNGSPPKTLKNPSLPLNVTAADVQYRTFEADNISNIGAGSILTFQMNLSSTGSVAPDDNEAPSGFVWNKISVLASMMSTKDVTKKTASKASTSLQVFSSVTLSPRSSQTDISPATLDVVASYTSTGGDTSWMVHGSIQNLSVALLANYFFDKNSDNGASAVLGKLNLASLNILYTYDSGLASSFLITGVLQLGELELDLSYQYVSSKHVTKDKKTAAEIRWANGKPHDEISTITPDGTTRWKFEAFLGASTQSSTIKSITNSIVPGKGDVLPGFIGNIPINAAGDPKKAPIKLEYTGGNDTGSVLILWVSIGPFNMTFIQYRSIKTQTQPALVKKLLRISCDQIPEMDKIPLINQFPQPFDHLIYLWVEDDTTGVSKLSANSQGFTRTMVDMINKASDDLSVPNIQFKEIKKDPGNPDDLVLLAGHHFVIVSDNKVVLDHIFEPDKTTTANGQTNTGDSAQTDTNSETNKKDTVSQETTGKDTAGKSSTPAAPEAPATKGDSNTKAGPLSISAISLQYKNGSLFVGIDATLVIGPITFSVIGFTVEVELNNPQHPITLNHLADIITHGLIHVDIHGLEAGLDKEPLTLRGVFIHDTTINEGNNPPTSVESYRGGVSVGFKAWKVLAVGEYAIVTNLDATARQYKSIFIYGKLDGPLVELEFATISGVRLGFGYNSLVHLPKADKLYTFPLISNDAAAGGDDPRKILDAFKVGDPPNPPYVETKEGGVWFAAGMTITCFDCITLTAVLMFEIETKSDQNGVIIALLADGIFQMEPLMPSDLCLFYVEVLIKVELNFIEGYIAADAALSPASHVYVPQAHLTGSGSFYTFFPPNSHAGDFVVTIGGYHRAYIPPSHYPQNEQRLGLNFVVGNAIHVVGGAYVAVTPKCAMAGGSLHISLDVGPVSAYADIALDVFINFKPFYFIAEIRLSVGVECDIDILFATIHISISLDADLTLWGPDSFGGTAYVHFWFFGFSIDFGSGLRDPPGISLLEFYDIVRTAGPDSDPPPGDATTAKNPFQAQHKYSIEEGLFPAKPKSDKTSFPNTGATTEWKVLAGPLQIRIDCDFSLSSAQIITSETGNKDDATKPITTTITTTPAKSLNPIFAFPMHNTVPITSHLDIRIYFMENHINILQTDFRAELVLKQAPLATWSQYTPDNDPLHRISPGRHNKPSSLENGNEPTVELCQGVRIFPPFATLSKCPIVDFDATAAMNETLEDLPLPDWDKEQDVFLAEAFEADGVPVGQWSHFGSLWTGEGTNAAVIDADGNKLEKRDLRGDGSNSSGLIGLLVSTLGWDQRPPAETKQGIVQPVTGKDGKALRKEWELIGEPPESLAKELGYYYPYLPMVTGSLVSTAA